MECADMINFCYTWQCFVLCHLAVSVVPMRRKVLDKWQKREHACVTQDAAMISKFHKVSVHNFLV